VTAIESWFAMGGYAGFVWPAYGVTTAVLAGLALCSWRRHRRSGDTLARLQQPPTYPPPLAGGTHE
jgi:heme exporter protein D